MSRVHVRIEIAKRIDENVMCRVLSPDFSDSFEPEEIGILILNLNTSNYLFTPTNKWEGMNIMPPSLYQLEEDERIQIMTSKYSKSQYGAWSLKIDRMANKLLNELKNAKGVK